MEKDRSEGEARFKIISGHDRILTACVLVLERIGGKNAKYEMHASTAPFP